MSEPLLLTFNAGSSTVKIGLFSLADGAPRRMGKGVIDLRKEPVSLHLVEGPTIIDIPLKAPVTEDLHGLLDEALGWFAHHFDLSARASVVGHRIVHGGDVFAGPVVIDDAALQAIADLTPLAPLHQPQGVRLIRAIRHLRPGLVQTASFDTAFHRTQPEVARRFAIPRALHEEGIKRYGFHGLSYQFVAGALARRFPDFAGKKVVAAHLGSGASLCALDGGISRDSSMGFSTLDGIPMATRCGALDPGVLLHLLGAGGRTLPQLEDILYHRSGLLGLSGISADSRDLLESAAPEAAEAIAVFAFRIAGEVARLAASMGGLDGVLFTAGVGEHQPAIRAAVAERMGWLGLSLDATANAANAARIDAGGRVAAFVIPTDEEQVIADEAAALTHQRN
ncbi:acetate/propionate family kinase [Rhodovarius lipocyclicus]|uniref:acetate/propionate family kinase n=1 Tax=Rhodovarius lipocyclicus TaxID=268410 RepID=UPI00135AEB2A|nr:acetate/propionate family kinase [Rhodovarius lipocyclicus]